MNFSFIRKDYIFTIAFVILLICYTTYDIIEDLNEGLPFKHWFHEILIVGASVIFIFYKLFLALKRDKKIDEYNQSLDKANIETPVANHT